jgi:hypothetical protein
MKKLLYAAAAVLALSMPANAAIIGDVGINPTSSAGAFSNDVGFGAFTDQYTFQLVGGPQFLVIGAATNVYPAATDFILNFTGSLYQQVGVVGGGDDILLFGPTAAINNCGPLCQGFGGQTILEAGNYYLEISGFGSGTAGYGGNLAVAAVPEASTWLMMLAGFAGLGFMAKRRKQVFRLA